MVLTLDECSVITSGRLQKAIKKLILKEYVDPSDDEIFKHTQEELAKFEVNGQHFEFEYMPGVTRGHMWYFLCPKCGARAKKLFLPPEEASDKEHLYLCRNCHKLRNRSSVMHHNPLYKKVQRPLKRMMAIERKLEKGHLTADKVKELLDEYDALEEKMKSTHEYRVYMFKKKHGMVK